MGRPKKTDVKVDKWYLFGVLLLIAFITGFMTLGELFLFSSDANTLKIGMVWGGGINGMVAIWIFIVWLGAYYDIDIRNKAD